VLWAGCVGRGRTGSKERGKRGSWWVAEELGLTCFLLLRCPDSG